MLRSTGYPRALIADYFGTKAYSIIAVLLINVSIYESPQSFKLLIIAVLQQPAYVMLSTPELSIMIPVIAVRVLMMFLYII